MHDRVYNCSTDNNYNYARTYVDKTVEGGKEENIGKRA